ADHDVRTLDHVRLGEAFDGLQDDGEAERGEENGVNQGAHHLGADPAERVLVGGLGLLREAHGHQGHDQRDHVRQHVERVRQHRQGRRDAAHHHLHHEEAEGERQHAEQPDAVGFAGHVPVSPERHSTASGSRRSTRTLRPQ
uniref:Uncharacterized protein n=1 Tax=Denticeps clupeoides TaxID=299321 RepID=A0AAY4ET68_9TELE